MRFQSIGVGEGWKFVGVVRAGLPAFTPNAGAVLAYGKAGSARIGRPPTPDLPPDVVDPDDLDRRGWDTFVNGYGRVFIREPNVASVFEPKRPAVAQGAQS